MRTKIVSIAGGVFALTVLPAMPALAHVGTNPSEVPAGATSSIGFRFGHGCDGSPTVQVAMEIPGGVTGVSARAKSGWTVETEEGRLPEPVQVGEETVTEGVVRVTWSGGSLDAHQWDEFEIRARMPDAAGETVYFPVVQTCEQGELAWIQIPADGGEEPDSPAPGVTLVVAAASDHDHDAAAGDETSDDTAEGESAAADADEDGDEDDLLVWIAVALGAVGVVLGGAALIVGRSRA